MCCEHPVDPHVGAADPGAIRAWARGLPSGIIDTHVHTAPDVIARVQSDIELTRSATEAGYRALVLKNHHAETGARARIANEVVGGAQAYGGLVLNASCGGINVAAVEAGIALGAQVVWLPTHSSANHVAHAHGTHRDAGERSPGVAPVRCEQSGELLPAVLDVLDMIAAHGRTLATGHVSAAEIMMIVPEARRRGIANVIVTHPELEMIGLAIEDQLALADLGGVWFERVYTLTTAMFGQSFAEIIGAVDAVGAGTTIMASDLGQVGNPDAITGMRAYIGRMRECGITTDQIEEMTCVNPALALGLDSVRTGRDDRSPAIANQHR